MNTKIKNEDLYKGKNTLSVVNESSFFNENISSFVFT